MKKEIPLHIIPNLQKEEYISHHICFDNIDFPFPLSIYIHFPFCVNKCSFCPVSIWRYNEAIVDEYIEVLKREIYCCLNEIGQCKIESIHFGGGTPSLMKKDDIEGILDLISTFANINETEILVEAHPKYLSKELVCFLSELNCSTVNLGVQSFNNSILQNIGRNYTNTEILYMMDFIKDKNCSLGIDYISDWNNVDKMAIEKDFRFIEIVPPDHFSQYPLYFQQSMKKTYAGEEGGNLDRKIDLNIFCNQKLTELGYKRYSIYHYEKGGKQITHRYGKNQLRGGKWLGFGTEAYTYLGNIMYINSNMQEYMCGENFRRINEMKYEDKEMWEFLFLMRTWPVRYENMVNRYAPQSVARLKKILDQLLKYHYIESEQDISLTWRGIINIEHLEKVVIDSA